MDIKINKTEIGTLKYPPHCHKNYEIMYYTDGEGEMWTECKSIPFSPGTAIIVPPGIMHGSVSDGGFVNISIEYDFNGLLALEAPILISDTPDGDSGRLADMIWNNRYGDEAYLAALCIAFVQYLSGRFDIQSAMARCIAEIKMKISDEAFNPEINVTQILQSGGYAEDYVRACFKKTVGKTPIEFLTELRIKHACYLIDIYGNQIPMTEIAERCGYLDYVYFSKKFKEYTGMSPRSYKM